MRFLAFIVCVLSASLALADEKKYGSFILNTDIPDTLFFVDEIKANDSFELRKAIRNHDIQNIVLASPGGSVWEGLQMAGIIFDKKLRTYIPRDGVCASACSYLFFAGNERLADGKLGVHQAYSSNTKKQQPIGQTQYVTQFTVSEIIGFLNEFGTPAFVYERMFQDIDMYFFDQLELGQLNSEFFGLENSQKIALVKFIMTKIEEREEKELELTQKEMIALIQTRLKEVGCNPGPADGIWGRRTQNAAIAFAKKAGLPTSKEALITEAFIEKLSAAPTNYCPRPNTSTKKTKSPQKTAEPTKFNFYRQYDFSCLGGKSTIKLLDATSNSATFTNGISLFNVRKDTASYKNFIGKGKNSRRAYLTRNSSSMITEIKSLEKEILQRQLELETLRKSTNYEIMVFCRANPQRIEEIASQQIKALETEIFQLQHEADTLGTEISELTGEVVKII